MKLYYWKSKMKREKNEFDEITVETISVHWLKNQRMEIKKDQGSLGKERL